MGTVSQTVYADDPELCVKASGVQEDWNVAKGSFATVFTPSRVPHSPPPPPSPQAEKMSSGDCAIPPNGDVAGIGIRLSIYITTLIISLVPNVEATEAPRLVPTVEAIEELRGALMTAAGLTGFSLLITALIETANRSLTLYHAVVIFHMLSFLGVATNPAGSYRATPARLVLYWATTWMVFVLLLCWIIDVWATAPTFGTPGACNGGTIYVLLFANVRATVGWLRWIFVTAAALTLFVLVFVPIFSMILFSRRNQEARDEQAENNSRALVPVAATDNAERAMVPYDPKRRGGPSNITAPRDQSVTEAVPPSPQRAFTSLSTVSDNKLHFFLQTSSGRGIIGRFLASIYGVTMLELTIHRNKKHVTGDENQWAFGQIVALLITVGSLNEVIHFILGERDRGTKIDDFLELFGSPSRRRCSEANGKASNPPETVTPAPTLDMIGNIKERETSSTPTPPSIPSTSRRSGFPKAQHRLKKSAFLGSRESQNRDSSRGGVRAVPHVAPVSEGSHAPYRSDEVEPPPLGHKIHDVDEIRAQVSAENEQLVQSMSDEQRETERQEIYARFGPGIGDVLRRAREARERQNALPPGSSSSSMLPGRDVDPDILPQNSTSSEPSARSKKRALRFADVKSSEIYTYESQPSSPKKGPIGLLPPTSGMDDSVIPLNLRPSTPLATSEPSLQPLQLEDPDPEEGTPEDIRRRYFPTARADAPTLAWISSSSPLSSDTSTSTSTTTFSGVRYDLAGDPIPLHLSSTLPTHLGLHHHAGSLAGYTLADLLHLSRSTVPAQRSTMLEVLAGVVRRLRTGVTSKGEPIVPMPSHPELLDMRRKIMAVGVEALGSKGTTAIHATEVVWECIVAWDPRYLVTRIIGSVELEENPASSPSHSPVVPGERSTDVSTSTKLVSDLPLPYLLPLLANHFKSPTLPRLSLSRLLQVLHRIALQSHSNAHEITSTPDMVRSLITCFLLPSSSVSYSAVEAPSDENYTPDPLSIRIFTVLAESSKEIATLLIAAGIPDSLLRFVAVLPPPFNPNPSSSVTTHTLIPDSGSDINVEILIEALHFSQVLARYGLYSHVASTAAEPFSMLTTYVLSEMSGSQFTPTVMRLAIAWLQLLEAWITCATDPHCTTPPHDILWSQIVAWRWSEDILALWEVGAALTSTEVSSFDATGRKNLVRSFRFWAVIWNATAAWLEGASVNGVRGGEEEKRIILAQLTAAPSSGSEKHIVLSAIQVLRGGLDGIVTSLDVDVDEVLEQVASAAAVLHGMVRLAAALHPSSKLDSLTPLPARIITMIDVPFEQVHTLCEWLVAHPIWTSTLRELSASAPSYRYAFLRPVSALLVADLRLSRKDEGSKEIAWLAHAFRILSTALLPGDESLGDWICKEAVPLINAPLVGNVLPGWRIPEDVWNRGGITIIAPFLSFALLPAFETAKSDGESDTPVFIAPYTATPRSLTLTTRQMLPSSSTFRRGGTAYGLPAPKDWPFAPLNDLLRSGTSKVFSTLTLDWTASETDVVRATLLFGSVVSHLLGPVNGPGHSEAIPACMKVFMLEHGQKQEDSAEEVFRDTFVSNAMSSLLSSTKQQSSGSSESLEDVSRRFLGHSTPFYQLYTDFLALYDAISFSDPLFASLLIPPLSMSYAPDYRKLLWNDFGHVLRTVRTEPSDPAILNIHAFLWPVEQSSDLVSAYLAALCRGTAGGVHGVLRLIAVHHVACHIWADLTTVELDSEAIRVTGTLSPSSLLKEDSESRSQEDRARKLLSLLVSRAPPDAIRDVVLYRQRPASDGGVLLPPECFDDRGAGSGSGSVDWRRERMECVARWGGASLRERLQGLLGVKSHPNTLIGQWAADFCISLIHVKCIVVCLDSSTLTPHISKTSLNPQSPVDTQIRSLKCLMEKGILTGPSP
ncbi:hypothetical protein BS47DRAFT_1390022 [Hydnum rufescens UP504]|uniref:Uncharacterized protein n=1 Tax=Hydnum rufescens UP504 TaxID=1448309 RepID=A0A9P6B5C2_9AGAM|nr:hypothetical protein BS47DRAFT_1390022 [Hydnum rufescens UP504]